MWSSSCDIRGQEERRTTQMAKEVRVQLTAEQKAKIKSAIGKTMTEIRVSSLGKNVAVSPGQKTTRVSEHGLREEGLREEGLREGGLREEGQREEGVRGEGVRGEGLREEGIRGEGLRGKEEHGTE